MSREPIVAIDGPAGAGKSTVSKRVAQRLGFSLIDTGAIYRSVALAAHRQGIALDDDAALARVVAALDIRFRFDGEVNHVFLGDEDVSAAIRTPEMSLAASAVSGRKVVRDGLLDLQRRLAAPGGVVLEGRDIGTVVCPDAEVKVFLTATPEERARRRFEELRAGGKDVSLPQTLEELRQRDHQDSTRAHAPLRRADDAVEVLTDGLGIDEVVERIVALAQAARTGMPEGPGAGPRDPERV